MVKKTFDLLTPSRLKEMDAGSNSREGHIEFHNVDWPKISERRNGLFSWSEHRNQNVENGFLVDQNVENE